MEKTIERKNNRMVKGLLIILLFIGLITLAGCWSSRELNEQAFVIGAGIDLDEDGKIKVTVQLIQLKKVKKKEELATLVLASKGETLFEAIRKFIPLTGRKMLWSHLQMIVIGPTIAQKDITPILDFFIRDHEIRPTPSVIFSQVPTEKILTARSPLESITALGITKGLEAQNKSLSFAPRIQLYQFNQMMLSPGKVGYAPMIYRIKKGVHPLALVEGMAVIKGGKWIGELNSKETRGVLWVRGEVEGGILVIPIPGTKEKNKVTGKISLEIMKNNTSIKPVLKEGDLSVTLDIKSTMNIGEILGPLRVDRRNIEDIKHNAAMEIKREVKSSLEKTQKKWKADIYGIKDAVHRKYPDYWKKNKEKWEDIFSDLPIEVNVSVDIPGQGLSKHSEEE